ncbi:MAG TPA: hypothetical protein VGM90_12760 [Kofleriaceae bacterium]|jgi:hypothetical protein
MKVAAALVAVIGLVACTKSNPKSCLEDGVCSDPQFPFCDTQGTLGGIQGECIAVTCEPNSFAECRDHVAVTCNASGDNYSTTTCDRACMPETNGCQLCTANETACTNGTVATCDGTGEVTASYACPLGCNDEVRCRELDPSNGLGTYFDQTPSPIDLSLSGVTIDTATGTINGAVTIPSFLTTAPDGGAAIRVFVGRHVDLGNVTVVGGFNQPALAILATDDLIVSGQVVFAILGGAAGGVNFADCKGGSAIVFAHLSPAYSVSQGGGGGGFGTSGGNGGTTMGLADPPPPSGGVVSGDAELVPLRGGCGGSLTTSGGGAIQLVSQKSIYIGGTIDVRGQGGIVSEQQTDVMGTLIHIATADGGGAGGGVLLEAPTISFSAVARILATGGSGASREQAGVSVDDGTPASGAPCPSASSTCAQGGSAAGARPTPFMATDGSNLPSSPQAESSAGGGGGGMGRIRINTVDATYQSDMFGTVLGGVTTSGTVTTQ